MVKFFYHKRTDDWTNIARPIETEELINKYAETKNLDIVSVSCMKDVGVYVAFKEKS